MKSTKPYVYKDDEIGLETKESDLAFEKIKEENNFSKEQAKWNKILEADGFKDIEDQDGNLEEYDRRTIAWDNRERILNFHLKLNWYLTTTTDLKPMHRKVLQGFSDGLSISEIMKKAKRSETVVTDVIRKYKKIILAIK